MRARFGNGGLPLLGLLVGCWAGIGLVGWAQEGVVDRTFAPGGGSNAGLDADVFSVVVQPDGKVLAGGAFTKVGKTARGGVARFNSDGSLDTSFDPGTGADGLVEKLVLEADGSVLVGGRFGVFDGVARRGLARLGAEGVLDGAYAVEQDGFVLGMALQGDGRLVIVGSFTTVQGAARRGVARLMRDGQLDGSFDPGGGADRPVHAVALLRDGAVLIGGQFLAVDGRSRVRVARLLSSGQLDEEFDVGAGAALTVTGLAVDGQGRALVAGEFMAFGAVPRNHLARLLPGGELDTTFDAAFNPSAPGAIAVEVLADGKLLAVGGFYKVAGLDRACVVRLEGTGVVDPTFDVGSGPTGLDGFPPLFRAVAVAPDGKVVVGGGFGTVSGFRVNHLVRLEALAAVGPPRILGIREGAGGLVLSVETGGGGPCVVERSADLVDWGAVYTNAVPGGWFEFMDAVVLSGGVFYRAWVP